MRSLLATCLIASLVTTAWAQNSGGARAGKPMPYAGGGIRGATGDMPDGWLVSPGEAVQFGGEAGFNESPALRPRAVVPLIDQVEPPPAADQKVKSPFKLSVRFRGQRDVPIDPASLRVLYGAQRVDITDRILKSATVTPEGLTIEQVQLPPGKHRLTVQVQDSRQRSGERDLRIEVE